MSTDVEIGTPALTTWGRIKKVWPAFLSEWIYILVGLGTGFALLVFQRLLNVILEHNWIEKTIHSLGEKFLNVNWQQGIGTVATWFLDVIAFISEHLGVGFIVAALAVLFYEWGAQLKETVELNKKLIRALAQSKLIIRNLNLTTTLYTSIDTKTKNGLKWCLDVLLVGPTKPKDSRYLEEAAKSCQDLVLAISRLREQNKWGSKQYIEFITKHIDNVVGHNAGALASLRRGKQDFQVPPTAAGMADEILAKQMEAMEKGDVYEVVSDLTSWQGSQLELMFSETHIAVTKGIKVRRVFNLLPYIRGGNDGEPLPDSHKEILQRHLSASESWVGPSGELGYEIMLLWPDGYKVLKNDPRVKGIASIETLHFGLFVHQTESIKYQVTRSDLSDMELSWNSWDENTGDGRTFKAVWAAALEFPKGSSIDDRVSKVISDVWSLRNKAK